MNRGAGGESPIRHSSTSRPKKRNLASVILLSQSRVDRCSSVNWAATQTMGGVTDRVVLDNTTIAVKQVLTGRDRVQTDAFQAFRGAYPFAAAFCAPAKGWEKGSVETGVKYVRNLVFRPLAG